VKMVGRGSQDFRKETSKCFKNMPLKWLARKRD
jgi:hypothetical protein